MPVYGKCPRCEGLVSSPQRSTLEAPSGSKTYNAATFLCPHCQTVLGAGIAPVAVQPHAATSASKRFMTRLGVSESALMKLKTI